MGLYRTLLGWNGATNRLFNRLTRRPVYIDVYKRFVTEAVASARDVLHLGSGPVWLGEYCDAPLDAKRVVAVDPDAEELARNPASEKYATGGEHIPLPDESIDVITSEHVVEHLTDPDAVLREAHRLLRPGGRFIFTTPNALSYFGIATRATPLWFHRRYLNWMADMEACANRNPYPTAYRMNTLADVRRLAARNGFRVRRLETGVDYPTYTYPLPVIHQIVFVWHLLLDRFEFLAPLRITLIGELEKDIPARAA